MQGISAKRLNKFVRKVGDDSHRVGVLWADASAVVVTYVLFLWRFVEFGIRLQKPVAYRVSALMAQQIHLWDEPNAGVVTGALYGLCVIKGDGVLGHTSRMRRELVFVSHEQDNGIDAGRF